MVVVMMGVCISETFNSKNNVWFHSAYVHEYDPNTVRLQSQVPGWSHSHIQLIKVKVKQAIHNAALLFVCELQIALKQSEWLKWEQ